MFFFSWNSEAYVAGEWTAGGEYLWSQHDAGWPCWCFPLPQRSPSLLAAGPEAAVAVAVTVGSFSDPEAAVGKRWGKQVIHWFIERKHEFWRRGFLDHKFFFQHFCWQWNVFLFERSLWKKIKISGRSLMAWLICWSIPCFWVPRTFQRGALRKDGKEWNLENFFFRWRCFLYLNEMDDFSTGNSRHWKCFATTWGICYHHNMKELLSTTYTSYFNWKDSKIKLSFLQSFVEIFWKIKFLQFFFLSRSEKDRDVFVGCVSFLAGQVSTLGWRRMVAARMPIRLKSRLSSMPLLVARLWVFDLVLKEMDDWIGSFFGDWFVWVDHIGNWRIWWSGMWNEWYAKIHAYYHSILFDYI